MKINRIPGTLAPGMPLRRPVLTLVLAITVLMLLAASARPAHAATYTVDRRDDPDPTMANACTAAPNDCSLRWAIVAANAAAEADIITVPAGTYTLTRTGADENAASTGDLDVTGELTITGAGARTTSVVGGAAPFDDRTFDIRPDATTTITGLTITGGKVTDDLGGGVQNGGDLALDKVAVKGNTAGAGGAIYSYGSTLNITDITISGNSATQDIGGVLHSGGTANITNSTISGNQAARYNGGVAATDAALMNIRNSTIASNTSSRLGGGIITAGPATLVTVKNTVVASNTLNNCDTAQLSGGIISSQGNNISSDSSCSFAQSGDKQNANPLIGSLQNNGGPTDTHALLAGSPAIDAGTNAGCPTTDQRGVTRPQDGDSSGSKVCDIGAFEIEKPPDTTAPNTNITSGPSGLVRNTSASFGFSSSESGSTFQCSLNGAAFAGCTSPKSYSSLANKLHTFKVRATDAAGNMDQTPATRIWTVDTKKPIISRLSPKPGASIRDRTPTIKATIKDNATNLRKANIKLYVDGKRKTNFRYSVSTDRLTYTTRRLAYKRHTVRIVVRDQAGNVGVKSWRFTVKKR